jgi:hypothetical protein
MVIEVPPGLQGIIDDFWQRPIPSEGEIEGGSGAATLACQTIMRLDSIRQTLHMGRSIQLLPFIRRTRQALPERPEWRPIRKQIVQVSKNHDDAFYFPSSNLPGGRQLPPILAFVAADGLDDVFKV